MLISRLCEVTPDPFVNCLVEILVAYKTAYGKGGSMGNGVPHYMGRSKIRIDGIEVAEICANFSFFCLF